MLSSSWSLIISDELFIPVCSVKNSNSERYFNSKSILLLLSPVKHNLLLGTRWSCLAHTTDDIAQQFPIAKIKKGKPTCSQCPAEGNPCPVLKEYGMTQRNSFPTIAKHRLGKKKSHLKLFTQAEYPYRLKS